MARPFSNDMFQDGYEPNYEPDYSGIMNMRKDANESAKSATDQYEADVADYKNTQATEAEEGIASLPDFPSFSMPDISSEDFQFEDIDMTGMVPDLPVYTNPYVEVFTPAPAPVELELPDLGLYDYNNNIFEPEPTPYIDPYEQGDNYVTDDAIYNPTDDNTLPDYPFVDPETGGSYVLVPGTPVNPGPGVVVTDPVTGDLPDGYVPYTGVGPAGTTGPTGGFDNEGNRVGLTDGQVDFDVPFDVPPPSGLGFNEIDLSEFGIAPEMVNLPSATYAGLDNSGTGLANGGRVPMGNNNRLNSGLSRLPINQQNDTLTQVFQSGFRPRR